MHTGVVPKTVRTVLASCTMQQVHRAAQTACRPSLPRPRGVCALIFARIQCAQCPAVVAPHVSQRNSCEIDNVRREILFEFETGNHVGDGSLVRSWGRDVFTESFCCISQKTLLQRISFPVFLFVNECDSCVT